MDASQIQAILVQCTQTIRSGKKRSVNPVTKNVSFVSDGRARSSGPTISLSLSHTDTHTKSIAFHTALRYRGSVEKRAGQERGKKEEKK